jgi:hypothetical protein
LKFHLKIKFQLIKEHISYKKEHLRLQKGAQVTKRSNLLLFVTLKVTKRSNLGYEKEHRLQKGAT